MKLLVLSFSTSRYPSAFFRQFIRKARLEKGLKQTTVAKMVGVDEMTIVNWGRYRTAPLRRRAKVMRMLEQLGLDFRSIIALYP